MYRGDGVGVTTSTEHRGPFFPSGTTCPCPQPCACEGGRTLSRACVAASSLTALSPHHLRQRDPLGMLAKRAPGGGGRTQSGQVRGSRLLPCSSPPASSPEDPALQSRLEEPRDWVGMAAWTLTAVGRASVPSQLLFSLRPKRQDTSRHV